MCKHEDGSVSNLFGIPVDPCVYEDIEAYRNVTVFVRKCVHCGNVDIAWERQEDTEEIDVE